MPTVSVVREIRYNGRAVLPGQTVDVTDKEARVLVAIGKATLNEDRPSFVDLPKRAQKPVAEETGERDELSELRAEYQEIVGKRPFHGWDVDELREKMMSYRNKALSGDDLENK